MHTDSNAVYVLDELNGIVALRCGSLAQFLVVAPADVEEVEGVLMLVEYFGVAKVQKHPASLCVQEPHAMVFVANCHTDECSTASSYLRRWLKFVRGQTYV